MFHKKMPYDTVPSHATGGLPSPSRMTLRPGPGKTPGSSRKAAATAYSRCFTDDWAKVGSVRS